MNLLFADFRARNPASDLALENAKLALSEAPAQMVTKPEVTKKILTDFTARLRQSEVARLEQPAREPAVSRKALTEEACLTTLSVLCAMLLLVALLLAAKLVYFGLSMQNVRVLLPSSGAF